MSYDLGRPLGRMKRDTHAGFDGVHGDEPDDQRKRRQDLEIDKRLHPHTANLTEIAVPRDPHNKRRENEGSDQALDQTYEDGAEGAQIEGEFRPEPADKESGGHAKKDIAGEGVRGAAHLVWDSTNKNPKIQRQSLEITVPEEAGAEAGDCT